MSASPVIDRVVSEVDRAADEIVRFTVDLVRIPTINPPGEAYEPCARMNSPPQACSKAMAVVTV